MDIQEIKKQLDYLEETKQLIKEQLVAKGQPVDENTTFREYVDNMNDLVDTTDANAETSDIATGKSGYVDGQKVDGNLRDIASGSASSFISTNFTVEDKPQFNLLDFTLPFTVDLIHRQGSTEQLNVTYDKIATPINLSSDQIKAGETVLGINGKTSVVDTEDANAVANEIGKNKSAYVNGSKVIGNVPMVEADNHILLNKTEKPESGEPYRIISMHKNINDGTVSEVILTDGQILDLSTLPEDITGKNVFIYWGTDDNFDRWGMFITDMDSTFCLAAHDNTYAMNCRDKATRGSVRDMSYYTGARTSTGSVDINNVDWGTKTVWNKQYLVEIYVLYNNFNVYATEPVYWGQFNTYSNIQFAGATQYRYYQDNKITYSSAGLVQKNSLLAKENSHIYTPIFTELLVQKEGITSNKIKAGESILGVQGSASVVNTSDANAIANDIVNGKTAYVNGSKITGDLTTYASGEKFEQTISMTAAYDSVTNMLLLGSNPGQCAFKGGTIELSCSGNTIATSANITTDKIKSGETVLGVSGKSSVVDTSDANALSTTILDGYSAYVNGQKVQGTITTTNGNSTQYIFNKNYDGTSLTKQQQLDNITVGGNEIKIKTGIMTGGLITAYRWGLQDTKVLEIAINGAYLMEKLGLTQQNLKYGETVLNIPGLYTASNNPATANDILTGKEAFVNGQKIIGTYAGSAMKEYASVTAMNNDIANIGTEEVVKVTNISMPLPDYYIKTYNETTTAYEMVKLVKESETMSPQEYEDANDIADEILGE